MTSSQQRYNDVTRILVNTMLQGLRVRHRDLTMLGLHDFVLVAPMDGTQHSVQVDGVVQLEALEEQLGHIDSTDQLESPKQRTLECIAAATLGGPVLVELRLLR